MATAVLTSPLDVLKTRLQSDFYRREIRPGFNPSSKPSIHLYRSAIAHFRETFEILFSIHRVEGWRSLFKGLGPSLTGVVPATAIKFYAYGNCKRILPEVLACDKEATVVHIVSAATAGIFTGTITNPIWLIKTRLQLDKANTYHGHGTITRQYKNSLDCFRRVLQQEGVRGLYRGLGASYLGVIETTLHLTAYERFKGTLLRKDIHSDTGLTHAFETFCVSAASGFSKLFAVLIAYPHEVMFCLSYIHELC